MTLQNFANNYPTFRLDLAPGTAYQYRMCAKLLTEFHGKPIKLRQLKPEIVLGWLRHLTDLGRSASTVNSHRASILTLWRAAHARHLAPPPPNVLECPKRRTPTNCPIAWQPADLEKLIAQANLLEGPMQYWGVSRREYWVSLLLCLYDTGARIGAALHVRPADLDLDDCLIRLRSTNAKTLLEQPIRISQQTADAIRRVLANDPTREHVWPCGKHRHELYRRLKLLLVAAGLPADRLSMFHRIRRTNATQTALHGSLEMASAQLGHTSVRMTLRSYIDQRVMRPVQAADVIPRLKLGSS